MILYIYTGEEQVLRKSRWELDTLSMLNREGSRQKQVRCQDASPLWPTQKEERRRQCHKSLQITNPSHVHLDLQSSLAAKPQALRYPLTRQLHMIDYYY